MPTLNLKQLIKRELPRIFREDVEIHRMILDLAQDRFADKRETDSRFDRMLDELRRDREEQSKKWAEQNKKWEEENKKWAEHQAEDNKKWTEYRAEDRQKWEEHQAEDKKKWDEHQAEHKAILQEIHALARKHDSTIGALGARWGLNAEASFRNALASILSESFGVQVLNITEFDDTGEVFGRPDQIELDVIIRNGMLIICEIKASMSRSDVYTFDRKCRFYERLHHCAANRRLIVSPMVRDDARRVAAELKIEVFSYAEDVQP